MVLFLSGYVAQCNITEREEWHIFTFTIPPQLSPVKVLTLTCHYFFLLRTPIG